MISYDYALLAVGENWRFEKPYSTLARQFTIDKNTYNNNKVHITTTDDIEPVDNLSVYKISKRYPLESAGRFNYNTKFLSIRNAFENSLSEYIIYIDSDLQFHGGYNEDKLQSLLSECKTRNFDIMPSMLSSGYRNAYEEKYDLLNISREDPIITFEENFLILKNTFKLKHFLSKWEELYWTLNEKNIYQWAEGLEIGIAARYADFNIPNDMHLIRHFFKTYMYRAFWTYNAKDEKSYRFSE